LVLEVKKLYANIPKLFFLTTRSLSIERGKRRLERQEGLVFLISRGPVESVLRFKMVFTKRLVGVFR
jgi:hypothetical protein